MKRMMSVLVVLPLLVPALVGAQPRPDFSGTWTVSSKEPANYNGSLGWGIPTTMVVRQSATEISIESGQFGARTLRVTYKLDGSDAVWEGEGWSQAGDVATVKWRSKARWDGSRLILYTWNMALNQMRDTMALNGATLTIMRATEQPGPSGNGVLTYTKGS